VLYQLSYSRLFFPFDPGEHSPFFQMDCKHTYKVRISNTKVEFYLTPKTPSKALVIAMKTVRPA
tara:strand:+ start:13661 stop:13852 length:192 start_codon:yes stop_codon:yes gene_type:complete